VPGEDNQSNESASLRALAAEAVSGAGSEPAANGPEASPGFWPNRAWLLGALLVAATVVAYLPVWRAGFIWDDDTLLLTNPGIQTPGGLARLWTSDFPLSTTTLWLEWRLWGANPLGYHLVNVLLHALSVVLLWRVLARLGLPGAWLAAALFAVHPVNVESVAWIAERKNTLCMVFYLLSLLCYLRFDSLTSQPGSARNPQPMPRPSPSAIRHPPPSLLYALSLLAFALALLSKSAVAPLPLVLLGLAWWRRGRLELRDVWRSAPFFALAAAMGLVSLWFQTHQAIGASMIDVRNDTFWTRLAGAGWAVWFYLYKAVLPLNLSFIYPRWRIDASHVSAYVPDLLLAAAFLLCWRYRRQWGKPLLFGLGYFVLLLLPILGFVNIYFMRYSLVADHWQYFAIIGPIALVAAGITRWRGTSNNQHPTSNNQHRTTNIQHPTSNNQHRTTNIQHPTSNNQHRTTNIQHPTSNNQCPPLAQSMDVGCWMLGVGCSRGSWRGRGALPAIFCGALVVALGVLTWRQAMTYRNLETLWVATLARNPRASIAHNNLGTLLLQQGRIAAAVAHFQAALAIQPGTADVHSNLGGALLGLGRVDEAVAQLQEALRIQPDLARAHNNLGNALLQKGQVDDAIAHYQKAVELQPGAASLRCSLGGALLQAGRVDEAVAQLQRALALQPSLADAQMTLGNALLAKGQVNEAIARLRKAVKLQPRLAGAHHNLGNALFQAGQVDEALAQFQQALAIQPDLASAHNGLGNALLRQGRVDEALAHFQQAVTLQPGLAEAHLNLANLLLQRDRVDEAIAHFQAGLDLQPNLAAAHNNFANALLRKGRVDEAIAHFQRALSLQPSLAEAHYNLGNALVQKGRLAEAVEHYEAAVAALPGNPFLRSNLAWLLATCPDAAVRNGARAVELAQQAERLSGGKDTSILSALAAAYAEAGRFPEAIATAQKACARASAAGDQALLERNQQLLEQYRRNQAYHEPPAATQTEPLPKVP
jgi:tetratricopeptide (TPR) repeat protein